VLTDRLRTVAHLIIKGEPAADIGSDHAYLPVYLVEQGLAPRVIATELTESPLQRARAAILNSSCRNAIELRKGDGLEALAPGEVSTVIIAGMGGETIKHILEKDWGKSESFKRFIFQPMSRAYMVRETLARQGWPIIDEKLVMENGRIFVIISSLPGSTSYSLSPLELDIGPLLIKNKTNQLTEIYLKRWMKRYQVVYMNLLQSKAKNNQELLRFFGQKIKELGVIMNADQS
jgi:tRNA (adenine22-N1)-methyltransferase